MSTLAFLRVARSMNLGLLDLTVLYELRRVPGRSMSDVAGVMQCKHPAHISSVLDKLNGRALVDFGQPKPGKRTALKLTPAGAAVLTELEGMCQ